MTQAQNSTASGVSVFLFKNTAHNNITCFLIHKRAHLSVGNFHGVMLHHLSSLVDQPTQCNTTAPLKSSDQPLLHHNKLSQRWLVRLPKISGPRYPEKIMTVVATANAIVTIFALVLGLPCHKCRHCDKASISSSLGLPMRRLARG